MEQNVAMKTPLMKTGGIGGGGWGGFTFYQLNKYIFKTLNFGIFIGDS